MDGSLELLGLPGPWQQVLEFVRLGPATKSFQLPKKLIRAALARKLLVRLNAKARRVRHELASAT